MSGIVIAVDGSSGVGKSTVCREVARRLGLSYLDTGATYRVAALLCLSEGIDLGDDDAVVAAVETMNVQIVLDPDEPRVTLDHEDVSQLLRSEAITGTVSEVAMNLDVRAVLGKLQRELILKEITGGRSGGAGIIAEGRDITTVVAPDADVRILMTADPEVRVTRRELETETAGLLGVREAVLGRDAKDAKVAEFHQAADGVLVIDTTYLTIDEVVAAIIDLAHQATL